MSYQQKYLKYKKKYIILKNMHGGTFNALSQIELSQTGRTDDELLEHAKKYYPLVSERDAIAKIATIRHHNIPSNVSFNNLLEYFVGVVSSDLSSTQLLAVPPSAPALSARDLSKGHRSEEMLFDYANKIFPAMDHDTKMQVIHDYMKRNRETPENISYDGLRMNLRFKNGQDL